MTQRTNLFACLIAIGLCVPGWAAAVAAADITIAVAEDATVGRGMVYLGDVARIHSDTPTLTARLARVPLGAAPAAGQRRQVPLSHIERSLSRSGFDVAELTITSSGSVIVSRAAHTVTGAQLEQIAADHLKTRIAGFGGQISVRAVRGARGIDIPGGSPVRYSAHTADPIDIRQPVPVKIVLRQNSRVVRTTWVTVDLAVMTPVVVTVRLVPRYQPITMADIRVEERDAAGLPDGVLMTPSQAVGKRALRMIPAGIPVVDNAIDLPALVRRGDVVQIIAEQGALRISARGEARANGRRGDRIPVRNLDSKKLVSARVIDAQTVNVEF